MKEPPRSAMAVDKVRCVGDAVAFVIADTVEQALVRSMPDPTNKGAEAVSTALATLAVLDAVGGLSGGGPVGFAVGGVTVGVLVAVWYAARKHRLRWLELTDFIAPLIPLALAAGRMGNFINGELYGRVTGVPWGMLFHSPGAGPLPRHPSQLYEFALEGVLLFAILWLYSSRPRPTGAVSGAFLSGYGAFRFIAEFFREPDDFLGLLALGLSMGQWLSLPMIAIGIGMLAWALRRPGKV
jgi:prolipoprotein diacylglyceryl transferase